MPHVPAPIDLSALPRELEGKWVLVRCLPEGQEVVAAADSPVDLPGGGLDLGDPSLIMTKVPPEQNVVVIRLDQR